MALPDCSEQTLSLLESNIEKICGVTDILLSSDNSAEALLAALFFGIEYNVTSTKNVRFKCNCDYQRIVLVLGSLPTSDLEHLLEQETTEMICHFCNEKHLVTRAEIAALISSRQAAN